MERTSLEERGESSFVAVQEFPGLRVAATLLGVLGLAALTKGLGWWGDPEVTSERDQFITAGVMFLFIVALLTYRRGLELDLVGGVATRWSAMLGIRRRCTVDLAPVTAVRLRQRDVSRERASSTAYLVQLLRSEEEAFELARVMELGTAQKLAEDVAGVLEVPLGGED